MSDASRLVAGRYRLDSLLGRGGMGKVWLGRDERLGREVAVKEIRLPTDLGEDQREALCERMLREARLTARLSHRGVVTVYDVVSEDGRPFIVMEVLRAPNLSDEIARTGPLQPRRVAEIGLQLLAALDAAHRDGIIHRDVKPSNVLLADDRVVLTDFGIATSESDPRMTSTGLLVGSPTYMSPERLRGSPTGPETDMWSLGATLYAAAEGQPPFGAHHTTMGTVAAVLTDPLPAPTVGGHLRDALEGLLDKDPARRLTSAQVEPLLRAVPQEPVEPAVVPTAGAGPWPAPQSAGTTVLRAQGPGAPVAAPVAAQPVGDSPPPAAPPRRRPGVRLLLLALAGLVVLALVVFAVSQLGGGTDDEPAVSAGEATASPSTEDPAPDDPTPDDPTEDPAPDDPTEDPTPDDPTETTAGPDVPAGYRLQQDPLGFAVAVPAGWERSLDGPTRVDYVSPDGSTFLRVDQVEEARPDAEQAWLDSEPSVADSLPGYERIRIEPVDYRTWDTADWEFTWEGDAGTVHVLNRGIGTDTRGFALYVSAPDSAWDSEGLPLFETAAATFQPVE